MSETEKKIASAKRLPSGKIMLENVRVNWPCMFSVPTINGEEGRPGCTVMLHKEHDKEAIDFLKKAIVEKCRNENKDKEKEGKAKGKGKMLEADRFFLRNGDNKSQDEYNNHYVINCHSKRSKNADDTYTHTMPRVIDAHDPDKIVTDAHQKPVFYSGCRANLLIEIWFQDSPNKMYGKRVNTTLISAQFAGNDEPLSATHVSDADAVEGFESQSFADSDEANWDEEAETNVDTEEEEDAFGDENF